MNSLRRKHRSQGRKDSKCPVSCECPAPTSSQAGMLTDKDDLDLPCSNKSELTGTDSARPLSQLGAVQDQGQRRVNQHLTANFFIFSTRGRVLMATATEDHLAAPSAWLLISPGRGEHRTEVWCCPGPRRRVFRAIGNALCLCFLPAEPLRRVRRPVCAL